MVSGVFSAIRLSASLTDRRFHTGSFFLAYNGSRAGVILSILLAVIDYERKTTKISP